MPKVGAVNLDYFGIIAIEACFVNVMFYLLFERVAWRKRSNFEHSYQLSKVTKHNFAGSIPPA